MKRISPWIYFAGKITKNGWRNGLFTELRNAEDGELIHMEKFTYVGPYFISCGHGCSHAAGGHGLGKPVCDCAHPSQLPRTRDEVPDWCQRWMSRAELVFAWIDCRDCFGTLTELGWAHMQKKPVYLAFANHELMKEMWFATKCPRTWSQVHDGPLGGLTRAIELYSRAW